MSWLWKGDASSPASFEKALSKLSTQITAVNVSLESTRSRGRRLKALWTLYATLTYLVFLLILVLVIGPQDWTIPHYSGLVGGPTVIYGVRLLVTSVFGWRAGRQQAHLNTLQKQRNVKIADLKKATKYDSTQELLQKYGGGPPQREINQTPPSTKGKPNQTPPQVKRTGIAPPPTANIPGRQVQPPTTPPQRPGSSGLISSGAHAPHSPISPDEPGFAPNAFGGASTNRVDYQQTPHWYDRILDVMLGEDEHSAKNRIVLLCQNCRLVNGQAPPGIKTLEQLGKWRCASCGTMNGTETESMKEIKKIMEQPKANTSEEWQQVSRGDGLKDGPEEMLSENLNEDTGKASGKAQDEDVVVTKRVTRSSGQDPVEGL